MDLRLPVNPANDNTGSNIQYHLRASFWGHIPRTGGNGCCRLPGDASARYCGAV